MSAVTKKWQALGRLPKGRMNKTETAYAAQLELRKAAGEVAWWVFEGLKLRLADAAEDLTAVFAGLTAVRGRGLVNPDVVRAAQAAGVTTIVTDPVLPALLAVREHSA